MVQLAPTPKDVVLRDGTAQLYHFRPIGPVAPDRRPLLLVPSMINRWYVLDLRAGASVVEALVKAGFDVWCIDWGAAEQEDRYLKWEDVIARLGRMVRRVRRETGADKVGLLGYCMGATLSGIYTALNPDMVAAFVNLAGPFDFSHAGLLGTMTKREWFDAEAVTAAGNITPFQMQSGFITLRPTAQISKWIALAEKAHDQAFRDSFEALETWANDNIPFPAAAYVTYIDELYQRNLLIQGKHHVAGKRVDLANITCPVLAVVTSADTICPPPAACALIEKCGATDKEVVTVPGGHVGGVVGSKASQVTYPAIARWLEKRLAVPAEPKAATSGSSGEGVEPTAPEAPVAAESAAPRRSGKRGEVSAS